MILHSTDGNGEMRIVGRAEWIRFDARTVAQIEVPGTPSTLRG
jgi:hypothetical protein